MAPDSMVEIRVIIIVSESANIFLDTSSVPLVIVGFIYSETVAI